MTFTTEFAHERPTAAERRSDGQLTSAYGDQMGALVQLVSVVLYPAFCSVTASGQYRRPAAARSSASAAPPFGLRYPSRSCSRSSAKRFLRSLRKCRASALGAGPLAWLRKV